VWTSLSLSVGAASAESEHVGGRWEGRRPKERKRGREKRERGGSSVRREEGGRRSEREEERTAICYKLCPSFQHCSPLLSRACYHLRSETFACHLLSKSTKNSTFGTVPLSFSTRSKFPITSSSSLN